MRIEVSKLQELLAADIDRADNLSTDLSEQATLLADRGQDIAMGDGEAYRTLRTFLCEVCLPAARVQQDAALTLAADQRRDEALVREHLAWAGAVFDSDAVRERIDARLGLSSMLLEQAEQAGSTALPGARAVRDSLTALSDWYRDEAFELQRRLDEAMTYVFDQSIYAASAACAASADAAAAALRSARFDAASGVWDLSRVDLSWAPTFDEAYWRTHNRLVLAHYFELDAAGRPLAVRADAADELSALVNGAFAALLGPGGNEAFPAFINGLTSDQKYLLVWLGAEMSRPVGERSAGVARFFTEHLAIPLSASVPGGGPAGPHVPLVTDLFSFTGGSGQLYTMDVPGSIQKRAGFSDMTELFGVALGMDIDTRVVAFTYNGKEYRLQKWDGSYAHGSLFGGEVGLYVRDAPDRPRDTYRHMSAAEIRSRIDTLTPDELESICATYATVEGDDKPEIELEVLGGDGKSLIDRNAGKTYWNLTLEPSKELKSVEGDDRAYKDELSVRADISLKNNPGLFEAMYNSLNDQEDITVNKTGECGLQIVWEEKR